MDAAGVRAVDGLPDAVDRLQGHDGDPVGVLLLILAGIFAAIGIMGIVGAFAKTAEQSSVFSSIIAVVLGVGFLVASLTSVAEAHLELLDPPLEVGDLH